MFQERGKASFEVRINSRKKNKDKWCKRVRMDVWKINSCQLFSAASAAAISSPWVLVIPLVKSAPEG